jgi:hypothetical protein
VARYELPRSKTPVPSAATQEGETAVIRTVSDPDHAQRRHRKDDALVYVNPLIQRNAVKIMPVWVPAAPIARRPPNTLTPKRFLLSLTGLPSSRPVQRTPSYASY